VTRPDPLGVRWTAAEVTKKNGFRVTEQDLIAFRIRGYFCEACGWIPYSRTGLRRHVDDEHGGAAEQARREKEEKK